MNRVTSTDSDSGSKALGVKSGHLALSIIVNWIKRWYEYLNVIRERNKQQK